MRAAVQRVYEATVQVEEERVGTISRGLLVYLGVGKSDSDDDVVRMVEKLATLRIFEDDNGKMSRSIVDVGGSVLVVSQFTLYGDVRSGRRPSFEAAADPELAEALYGAVCGGLRARELNVETGRFRAMMRVHSVVDGPVTILIDTAKTF
jgi:D-tyrosyl-tRNA(Tyr) deacylase